MKFDVPKKPEQRRAAVSTSFFVEKESSQKREVPLEVPSFMRHASHGAKTERTAPEAPVKMQTASAPKRSAARSQTKKRKRRTGPAVSANTPVRTQNTKKRKKHRRRGSKILYYLMFGVVTFTVLFILSVTVLFRIDTISVIGDAAADKENIIAQSGIQMGDNLWRTNTMAAADRILAAHIEYDRVSVERNLPGGITIRLIPAKISAVCLFDGQYFSISEGGRIVAVSDQPPSDGTVVAYGCVLTGAKHGDVLKENDANKREALSIVLRAVEENELIGVTHIDISDLSTIRLYWQNRAELKFGSLDGLSYEVGCVKKLLEKEVAADEIVIIDDTLMNGTYYKRPVTSLTLPGTNQPEEEESGSDGEGTESSDSSESSDGTSQRESGTESSLLDEDSAETAENP